MNNTLKLSLIASLLLASSTTYAGFVPPGLTVAAGVSNSSNFDYSLTNVKNNIEFFNNDTNFFNGRDIIFDENSNAFLDTIRGTITAKPQGREKKNAVLVDAGFKNYDTFGGAQSFNVGRNQSFSGVGVKTGKVSSLDGGEEKFEIFGGNNTSGSAMNITMQVREKSQNELFGAHDRHGHHSSNSVIGHSPLVSSVMRIHGMGIQEMSSDGRIKTNPFALEATYRQEDFDATYSLTELEELINGCLFLGWLNTALDGNHLDITDDDRWVHAVQGNFDNMPDNPNRHDEHGVIGNAVIGTLQDYIDGTFTSIPGLSKQPGEIRVGDHGGDHVSNTVWAIVDHTSDFAVIPEPSTYALLIGTLAFSIVALSRRKLNS